MASYFKKPNVCDQENSCTFQLFWGQYTLKHGAIYLHIMRGTTNSLDKTIF